MALRLRALEKNILKYRAFQVILLLHEMESLRTYIIGSIRYSDKFRSKIEYGYSKELPDGIKQPFKKALEILVKKNIITEDESSDIQEINEIRNAAGHEIHNLVNDISHSELNMNPLKKYDYEALDRLEQYRNKIDDGLGSSYITLLSLRGVAFEQAELTYKEELARLQSKITRQYKERYIKKA